MNANYIKSQLEKDKSSFIKMPRIIEDFYYQGVLNKNEYDLYVYLKLKSDAYNKVKVNTKSISNELYVDKVKPRTIGNMIRDLKKSTLIFYPNIKGKRGFYSITFNEEIMLSEKTKQSLSQDNQVNIENKKIKPKNNIVETTHFSQNETEIIPDSNKNKNKDKNNKNKNYDISILKESYKRVSNKPIDFTPKTYEEKILKDIALGLGEESMAYLLSKYKDGYFYEIQSAYDDLIEYEESAKSKITNRKGYLNKIVEKRIEEKNNRDKANNIRDLMEKAIKRV